MADDFTQVESTLASTERLIARLVTLFEQGGSGAGVHLARGSSGNAQPQPQGQHPTPAGQPSEKDDYADLRGKVSSAYAYNKAADKALAESKRAFKEDVMHRAASAGNFLAVANNNIARLDSAAALALASQTGILTSTQLAGKIATQITGAARNVSQFGFAAGSVLTAIDLVTDVLSNAQRKIELEVVNANKDADAKYARAAARRKALDGSVTSTQVDADEVSGSRQRALDRTLRYTPGNPILQAFDPLLGAMGNKKAKDRAKIKSQNAIDLANERQQKIDFENAEAAVKLEQDVAKRSSGLQVLSSEASKALLNAKLESKTKDYNAEINALKDYEAALADKKDGKLDAMLVDKIIEVRKQRQQLEIERVKRSGEEQLAALENDPPYDKKGNVLVDTLRRSKISVLDNMMSDLQEVTASVDISGFKLTTQDRTAALKKLEDLNGGVSSAVDSAKSEKDALELNRLASEGQQNFNAMQARIQAAAIEANKTLKLTRAGIAYGAIDPTITVLAQIDAAKSELNTLDNELKTATGKSKTTLTGLIDAKKLEIKSLEQIDYRLAKRSEASLALAQRLELLDVNTGSASDTLALKLTAISRSTEQQRRQLSAAGDPAGKLKDAENAAQNAALAEVAANAKSTRDLYEEELAVAIKTNMEVTEALKIREKLKAAGRDYKNATQAQAVALAEQAANAEYMLDGDKPSSARYNRMQRIGVNSQSFVRGDRGGAESARLTSNFNESYRRRYGKLTDEEKDAAKEERSLNLQLARARRAISAGGGTNKQKSLVEYYNTQKTAADPQVAMLAQLEEANGYLQVMSGKPKKGK